MNKLCPNYLVERLSEFYNVGSKLFQTNNPIYIPEMENYPTVLTEMGLINREFAKTIFFSADVNQEGYYKYFVKRNGIYHVEIMNDYIPVDE